MTSYVVGVPWGREHCSPSRAVIYAGAYADLA